MRSLFSTRFLSYGTPLFERYLDTRGYLLKQLRFSSFLTWIPHGYHLATGPIYLDTARPVAWVGSLHAPGYPFDWVRWACNSITSATSSSIDMAGFRFGPINPIP